MSLNPPTSFGVGIKSKAMISSLSGEGSSLEVGSLSCVSTVSASAVSKQIFKIMATEDKTNISTPMLYGSRKSLLSFGSLVESASPKISGGGFAAYSRTSGAGGFKLGSSKGESEFETFSKTKKPFCCE